MDAYEDSRCQIEVKFRDEAREIIAGCNWAEVGAQNSKGVERFL